jgi:hypothetical protein
VVNIHSMDGRPNFRVVKIFRAAVGASSDNGNGGQLASSTAL